MASAKHNARPNRESLSKRLGRVAKLIRERDGHCCRYCGATEQSSGAHLHLDHLDPKVSGGADVASNLVLACRSCNSRRQDMALDVWCARVGICAAALRAHAAQPLPELRRAA